MLTEPLLFETELETSVHYISEALAEIAFPDYVSFRLLLNEFTQTIARYYDCFDHEILKNIALIEVNLKNCRDKKENAESFNCWQNAISEFKSALLMLNKQNLVE